MMMQTSIQLSELWLPLIGFVVGMIATMIGSNGAFFFPPMLILLFQVPPRIAIATSLAAVIPMGLIGSLEHYRRGNINLPVGIFFGFSGFAGALAGAWISGLLEAELLVKGFGIYAIALGAASISMRGNRQAAPISAPSGFRDINRRQLWFIGIFGFMAGITTGLFGTSGSLPVIAALFILRLPVRLIAGTCFMIVFFNAMSGFGGHFLLGEFQLRLILLLGSGAALGAFFGPWLLTYIRPERGSKWIRFVFAFIIMAMGLLLIFQ